MRKIIDLILQPIQAIGKHSVSDRVINFFGKRPYLIYVLAFIVTLLYIFFKYIFPAL